MELKRGPITFHNNLPSIYIIKILSSSFIKFILNPKLCQLLQLALILKLNELQKTSFTDLQNTRDHFPIFIIYLIAIK